MYIFGLWLRKYCLPRHIRTMPNMKKSSRSQDNDCEHQICRERQRFHLSLNDDLRCGQSILSSLFCFRRRRRHFLPTFILRFIRRTDERTDGALRQSSRFNAANLPAAGARELERYLSFCLSSSSRSPFLLDLGLGHNSSEWGASKKGIRVRLRLRS